MNGIELALAEELEAPAPEGVLAAVTVREGIGSVGGGVVTSV